MIIQAFLLLAISILLFHVNYTLGILSEFILCFLHQIFLNTPI